jgi:hypothetical protein
MGYNDEECTTKLCIPCRLAKNIFFHIRGFPEELNTDIVDDDYFLLIEGSKVSFEGFSGLTSIVNDTKQSVWQLLSSGTVIAHYNETNSSPIGLCEWYFHNSTYQKIKLKLTQV